MTQQPGRPGVASPARSGTDALSTSRRPSSRDRLRLVLRLVLAVVPYLTLKIFWSAGPTAGVPVGAPLSGPDPADPDPAGSDVLTALLDLAALALG